MLTNIWYTYQVPIIYKEFGTSPQYITQLPQIAGYVHIWRAEMPVLDDYNLYYYNYVGKCCLCCTIA